MAQKAALAVNMIELDTISSFGSKPKDKFSDSSNSLTGSDASDSLMSYDFESEFKQESSAFYYIDNQPTQKQT